MTHIKFCQEGCSTVAFCVSQNGEEILKQHYHALSATLSADARGELRRALFYPVDDNDNEIHTKEGAILRIWSHCKWTRHNAVARFIRSLARILDTNSFLFMRIGSENLHDTAQAGNFFDNPFHLWAQRRFVFMDDADFVRTTRSEEKERARYRSLWAKETTMPGENAQPASSGTCFWETLPCGLTMEKMMDVSTEHITQHDDELLDAVCVAKGIVPVIAFRKDDIGYFVHVTHDGVEESEQEIRDAGYSEEFIRLLRIARREGASMLCLSGDSTSSAKLPSFDW